MILEFHDILVSCIRWIIGLTLGTVIGLIVGALISNKFLLSKIGETFFDFLRAIPILGLVPVIQLYYGVDEFGKIILIAWATLFPIAYSVKNSVQKIPIDTQLILNNTKINFVKKIYFILFLGAVDGVYRAISIAIGIGWLVVVAAEMIGTYSTGFWRGGLGYKLFLSYELNQPETMFLCLAIFGLLGIVSSFFWNMIYKKYLLR